MSEEVASSCGVVLPVLYQDVTSAENEHAAHNGVGLAKGLLRCGLFFHNRMNILLII